MQFKSRVKLILFGLHIEATKNGLKMNNKLNSKKYKK